MVGVLCLWNEWQWVSLSQTSPSGIPGDLQEVIQPYQVWGLNENLEHKEGSLAEDSGKGFKEGSSQGELLCLEALHGATEQNPCMQGAGEIPITWGEYLCPSSLSLENLEGLTEKVGTIGLQSLRKNRCGAAKQ